ncbi:unnamed protein product [Schistosoma turkestanicum]|nr:unnamed protein product [Schistosoma turkestanicum]
MNFITCYVILMCTILGVYSDSEPLIVKSVANKLGENASHVSHKTFLLIPEYDDELHDFPHERLAEEERPFHKLSEILNSEPVLPLWLVSPIYYVVEMISRTFANLIISKMYPGDDVE